MAEPVIAPDAAPPGGHYSAAVRHGDLVFISGQLGVRPDGSHTSDLPFDEQVRQAMRNLLAVLAAAGGAPEDLLKVTAFIVGVCNWPAFNATYAEMLGAVRPARSVVPVPELHHGYLIEIEAVAAARPDHEGRGSR